MANQQLGSVRSRKRWKKLINAAIKCLLESPSGEERKAIITVSFPHFFARPSWVEGKRKKLLDKSAIWEYNAYQTLRAAYDNNLTDTSVADIMKIKREFSLNDYEDELDKLLDINIEE